MNAAEFAAKWIGNTNTERAAAQEHFIDICHMLGVPTPNTDRAGVNYAFEKGASKSGGGKGWADVWKRGHFGWEYKGHHKDLEAAYNQLLKYRESLENPPLLVVCDLDRFILRTNFTSTVRQEHSFTLEDLRDHPAEPLRILRALFTNPEALRPSETRETLTQNAARAFAALAEQLGAAGHDPQRVAHFLNKLLFVMFAEDASLLPPRLIPQLGDNLRTQPAAYTTQLAELFRLMSTEPGGVFGWQKIQWFNGGLFDGPDVLPLTTDQIDVITRVSLLDWSQIEPTIFGTLFERGLDPSKRSQLGAHYTDLTSIERIIRPVVIEPLEREWDALREQAEHIIKGVDLQQEAASKEQEAQAQAIEQASALVSRFLTRLNAVRVLDPACGSGNFLYVALQSLKALERQVLVWETNTLQTEMRAPSVGPHNVLGIELNSFAAELARVTVWIGEIQWMIANGFNYSRNPVLRPLNNIECRDAVLDLSDPSAPKEPEWPDAYAIIGNPPFLGNKLLRRNLGNKYVEALFGVYQGRLSSEVDLVCYWHEKARAMITDGRAKSAGLIATQGIRGGANRQVLERIKETGDIFMAWSDEPWVVEGAAVHVSIIGYDDGTQTERSLDGQSVSSINSDLTGGIDLTGARRLHENLGVSFMGDTKGGPFDITEAVALAILNKPNPHGKSNNDVVRPWVNGLDITRRPRNMYIIDFGTDMPADEAALYEAPFEYVRTHVEPIRRRNNRAAYAQRWWLHVEPRSGMRAAFRGLERYIATPRVAKHRLFVWLPVTVLADSAIIVFARDDDFTFGVLQSHAHELWALTLGTQLESRPRYTPTSTFETFPFPQPGTQEKDAVAKAAAELDTLRRGWLNPSNVIPSVLKDRTLTNLYNEHPTWLINAHANLDRAVYAAYGWPYPLDDQEILRRLLQLNAARAAQTGGAAQAIDAADEDEEDEDEEAS